jgi:hypothetical protein
MKFAQADQDSLAPDIEYRQEAAKVGEFLIGNRSIRSRASG